MLIVDGTLRMNDKDVGCAACRAIRLPDRRISAKAEIS